MLIHGASAPSPWYGYVPAYCAALISASFHVSKAPDSSQRIILALLTSLKCKSWFEKVLTSTICYFSLNNLHFKVNMAFISEWISVCCPNWSQTSTKTMLVFYWRRMFSSAKCHQGESSSFKLLAYYIKNSLLWFLKIYSEISLFTAFKDSSTIVSFEIQNFAHCTFQFWSIVTNKPWPYQRLELGKEDLAFDFLVRELEKKQQLLVILILEFHVDWDGRKNAERIPWAHEYKMDISTVEF